MNQVFNCNNAEKAATLIKKLIDKQYTSEVTVEECCANCKEETATQTVECGHTLCFNCQNSKVNSIFFLL